VAYQKAIKGATIRIRDVTKELCQLTRAIIGHPQVPLSICLQKGKDVMFGGDNATKDALKEVATLHVLRTEKFSLRPEMDFLQQDVEKKNASA
jgi:hypothetical protein